MLKRDRRSRRNREPQNSYIPLGQKKIFRSEKSNLSRKLDQFFNSDNEEVDFDEEKKLEEEEIEIDPVKKTRIYFYKELEAILRTPADRYYNKGSSSTKCRRCGEYGHIAKHCTKKRSIECHYCLGDHRKDRCPQDSCFRCGEMGHRGRNCPNLRSKMCHRCRKKGHSSKNCTFLINFRHMDDRSYEHKDVDPSTIKCVSCNNPGHLECYIKGNKIKKLVKRDQLYLETNLDKFRKEYGIEDGMSILKKVKKMQVKKLSDLAFLNAMELDTIEEFTRYDKSENREKMLRKRKMLKIRYNVDDIDKKKKKKKKKKKEGKNQKNWVKKKKKKKKKKII